MSKTRLIAMSAFWVIAIATHPVAGHTILLSRGTAVVECDRIVATLEIGAEDFVQHGYIRTSNVFTMQQLRDAVSTHGQHLTEQFIIRNVEGARISSRLVNTRFDEPAEARLDYRALRDVHVEYTLEWSLKMPPRYLTFQRRFGAAGRSVRAQLLLQVRSKDRETDRFIRLTSGGNVETLAFFACDPERAHASTQTLGRGERAARAEEALDVGRFKSVRAFVYIDEDRVRIDVFMPVTLVETWLPIDRADRDFLEPAEMNAARDRLLGLFTDQNQLSIDGRRASPEAVQLEFLGPCAIGLKHPEPTHRLGAWTARVGASLRYKVDSPPDNVELVWGLFNNAVLNAHATVVFNKNRHEHPLTTYRPSVNWQRPSQ